MNRPGYLMCSKSTCTHKILPGKETERVWGSFTLCTLTWHDMTNKGNKNVQIAHITINGYQNSITGISLTCPMQFIVATPLLGDYLIKGFETASWDCIIF